MSLLKTKNNRIQGSINTAKTKCRIEKVMGWSNGFENYVPINISYN